MAARPTPAALALAAALAAAGCRVDVDGAPCAGPGTTADCPDGQACGNDLRCSARALACAGARCTPGEGVCEDAGVAIVCTAGDPVCGRRVRDDCAARDLVCGVRRGEAFGACECPPASPGTVLVADPGGSPAAAAFPFPNGQEWPRECRFGRLGDALAAAGALAPAFATVRLAAEGGVAPVFGTAAAEDWPLLVGSRVAVAGATTAGPAALQGAPGVAALLAVEGAVEDLRVDAAGATTAVRAVAAGARLVRVDVSGAAGAALQIEADPAAATTVQVLGGSYGGSGVGIWIRGGRVSVAPDPAHATSAVASEDPGSARVAGNAGDGIVIGGSPGRGLPFAGREVSAALERVVVAANGGTGILLGGLLAPSRIRVSGCDVRGNGTVDPATYGTGPRKAGGVLVALSPGPQLTFAGNRLWANARGQLTFDSSGSWNVGPADCGPGSNVFACVGAPGSIDDCDSVDEACAVFATAGAIGAGHNVWPERPPYRLTSDNVTYMPYCDGYEAGVPPVPACP